MPVLLNGVGFQVRVAFVNIVTDYAVAEELTATGVNAGVVMVRAESPVIEVMVVGVKAI